MPPLALPTREFMEHARQLWEELGLPPLNVQAPWHGYTLEDWTDTWEQYARRTVAGDWEQTGKETLLRQRKDKMPEAPVRPGQNQIDED
jgi:4-hydroxy-3-polyprenylbenzoate decarboxylase